MFQKILIANRGEIACRIAKTAKRIGVKTVAVYSDADQGALHVRCCDQAVPIAGNTPTESYLDTGRILAAAKATGAQAIHPGYGFLSENAEFAQLCGQHAITFIGPSAESIRIMGSKNAARKTVSQAGVPILPGYDGDNQDSDYLQEVANQTGYPLLIKAVAGGGGKGMRRVDQAESFQASLESVKRESLTAFGDDAVLLERFLPTSRHIEVQVFGDHHGNIVHLHERDCSMQRRHQKVIEESPAPGISDSVRARITGAAIKCARSIDYRGAGTVEFLYSSDENFYFLEMNTRLQVEHPVTEMVTGQDLVEWQIRVAAGDPLPCRQDQIPLNGHAFEVRIYAENPRTGFLPSPGKVHYINHPDVTGELRVDTGISAGDTISPFYDPMICKLIAHGNTRKEALDRIACALDGYRILGVNNNIAFLRNLVGEPDFVKGALDTGFVERNLSALTTDRISITRVAESAAIFLYLSDIRQQQAEQLEQSDKWSPWIVTPGNEPGRPEREAYSRQYLFESEAQRYPVALRRRGADFHFDADEQDEPTRARLNGIRLHIQSQHRSEIVMAVKTGSVIALCYQGNHYFFKELDRIIEVKSKEKSRQQTKMALHSPMPGMVVDIKVKPDQPVVAGDILMIVEAMKMEHQIKSPCTGIVVSVNYSIGDQVAEGAVLMAIEQ